MFLKRLAYKGKLIAYQGKQLTYDYNKFFFNQLDLYGATYNDWDERSLPFSLHSGLTLLPYAYSPNSVYARDNVTGLPINCTFSRAGNGWSVLNVEINQSPATLARIDDLYYSDDLGYLVESSATNIVPYSYSLALWGGSSQIGTRTNGTGFLLNQSGYFTENNVNALHFLSNGINLGTSQNQSVFFSCFVKRRTGIRNFGLYAAGNNTVFQGTSDTGFAYFDLDNGVVQSRGNQAQEAIIKHVGDGWFYVSIRLITANNAGAKNPTLRLWLLDNSFNTSYLGDNSSGLFVTGVTTSVTAIPTTGSAVTRPAESLLIPTSNILTDVWLKTDQGEHLIEDFNSTDFPVHNYITNGKLLALMMPLRKFTASEKSKFNL